MKFTKKLYEGSTLYGNDMYVKDIDGLLDATEFSLLHCLDSFCLEQFYACSEYGLLCIDITVMQCSAFRANPLPDRHLFADWCCRP